MGKTRCTGSRPRKKRRGLEPLLSLSLPLSILFLPHPSSPIPSRRPPSPPRLRPFTMALRLARPAGLTATLPARRVAARAAAPRASAEVSLRGERARNSGPLSLSSSSSAGPDREKEKEGFLSLRLGFSFPTRLVEAPFDWNSQKGQVESASNARNAPQPAQQFQSKAATVKKRENEASEAERAVATLGSDSISKKTQELFFVYSRPSDHCAPSFPSSNCDPIKHAAHAARSIEGRESAGETEEGWPSLRLLFFFTRDERDGRKDGDEEKNPAFFFHP